MEKCVKCGRLLENDEIGLTKKIVNRASEKFYCIDCLASHFRTTKEELRKLIEHFREAGCTLFK